MSEVQNSEEQTLVAGLPWTGNVRRALSHWGYEDAKTKLLSLSENAVFRVEATDGSVWVLRLHRPGYRSAEQVESEMAWLDAVRADGRVQTPRFKPTLDGQKVCKFTVEGSATGEGAPNSGAFDAGEKPEFYEQIADLMEFLPGVQPYVESTAESFLGIGRVAAVLHEVSSSWQPPEGFTRPVWDEARMLGADGDYGDWRDTPEVTPQMRTVFEAAEKKIFSELAAYGKTPQNFGVVHTDLRATNLLLDDDGTIKVIDFDDCGPGWYLFDVADSFTFEEMMPNIEDMVRAYIAGYRQVGGVIPDADFALLPAMLLARRLNMVAWMEMRRETEWAKQIRGQFISETLPMAQMYLKDQYLPHMRAQALNGTLSTWAAGRTAA